MSDKFLGNGGTTNANLTNGSVGFYGSSLGAQNLDPSQPVKTNSLRQLYSTKLEINDINQLEVRLSNLLTNPYNGNMTALDFKTSEYNSINNELDKIQNIISATKVPDVTSISGEINANSFVKTSGTNTQYLMADGSVLNASANSGNSNFYLYNNTNSVSDTTPITGELIINNTVNINATMVYISHITRDNIDIEVFFKILSTLNEVYIQDQNNSINYIQYNIIGTPIITVNDKIAIPVVVNLSSGIGSTNFPVGHNILVAFFTNNIETDIRISSLENKTLNQTRLNTETSFIGTQLSSNVKMFSFTSGGSWAAVGFSGVKFTAKKPFNLIRYAAPTAFLGNASATRVISIFKNGIILSNYTLTKANVDGLGFSFYDWGVGLALDIGDYQIGLGLLNTNDYGYYNPFYTSNYPFFTNILRTNIDNGLGDLTISYILDYSVKVDKFIAPSGGTSFLKADGSYDYNTYLTTAGGTLTGDILQPLAPSASNSLTNKNYVDTRDNLKLNLTGGTLSGALTVGSGTYGIAIQPPTGGYNIIIGSSGGGVNSSYTGGSSVFIGDSAGLNLTTQLNNTYIGSFSGNANTNLYTNTTAIGYNAQNTASNQVSLGDTNITEVLTAGFYKGAGFKTPSGTSNDVLLANGTTTTITSIGGTKELELSYILATFVGIQYQHASGLNTTMSNSLWSALGSTSSAASTYAVTNNFTRQLCSANWTFPTQGDGQVCGYGSTITTGAQVNTKFPFGIYFSGGISDASFSNTGTAVPQNFWGLWNLSTAIPLNSTTQLLSRRDLIGFGSSQADANICIFTCSASVSIKVVDLGSSFPANRTSGAVSTDIFQLALWWDLTKVYYKAVNTTLNITVSGSFTPTVMPTNTISLYPQCCRIAGSGGASSSCRLQVQRFGVYY